MSDTINYIGKVIFAVFGSIVATYVALATVLGGFAMVLLTVQYMSIDLFVKLLLMFSMVMTVVGYWMKES